MATEHDGRSHNQPSHEQQVKGGQHSHQESQQGSKDSTAGQHQQGSGQQPKKDDGRGQNQPSHEQQVKGGQHSHSGGSQK